MRIETIVVTTNQKDLALFSKMNIHSDTIIANQSDGFSYQEEIIEGYRVRMITTPTKGVGINRNIGMQMSEADICILSDDDIVYYDNAASTVLSAFVKYSNADIISFSLSSSDEKKARHNKRNGRSYKLHGAARLAYRNISVSGIGLAFSHYFGGGALYSSGEDSLFCIVARRLHLKIYEVTETIGLHEGRESTWFKGYTPSYYHDRGAFLQVAFPRMKSLMCILLLVKSPSIYLNGNYSFMEALRMMKSSWKNKSSNINDI